MKKAIAVSTLFISITVLIFGLLIWKIFDQGTIVFTDTDGKDHPDLLATDPIIGSTEPAAFIFFYGDFGCENCADMASVLPSLLGTYPDDILLVWKDYPNEQVNPESTNAALAARCAQDEGMFWEYASLLYTHQRDLGRELYEAAAAELGIKTNDFLSCLDREQHLDLISASIEEGLELNIAATPTMFINGRRISGYLTPAELEDMVLNYIES